MLRINRYLLVLFAVMQCTYVYAKKDERYLYTEVSVLKETDYYRSYCVMWNNGIEWIHNPLRSFGAELNAWRYLEKGNTSFGIGARPVIKYYFRRSLVYRIFFEIKGGAIYMLHPFPEGGSKFNFTLTGSLGTDISLSEQIKIAVSVRYSHMSNWDLYGTDNNPTWDGLGGTTGIIWRRR